MNIYRGFYNPSVEYPMWKYYIDIVLDKIFNRTNEKVDWIMLINNIVCLITLLTCMYFFFKYLYIEYTYRKE
jgi:hypothetical protein